MLKMQHYTFIREAITDGNIEKGETALVYQSDNSGYLMVQFDSFHLVYQRKDVSLDWHEMPAEWFKLNEYGET